MKWYEARLIDLGIMGAVLILMLVPMPSKADVTVGVQNAPTCFTWSGGHKSAGEFNACTPVVVVQETKVQTIVKEVKVPVPAPVPVVKEKKIRE